MGESDALRLGNEPEERAIAVETPRAAALNHFEARLVVAEEQLVGDASGGVLVGELDGVGAVPLDVDDRDQPVRRDAADAGRRLEVLKRGQVDAPAVAGEIEKGTRWQAADAP